MSVGMRKSVVNNSIDRADFEAIYDGKAPWDIGKPQKAFVAVAERVTGIEVHPEFTEVKFSEGGPRAWFAIVRRIR